MCNSLSAARVAGAACVVMCLAAAVVGRAQQSKYPYPTSRDFSGVAPPPVVWASPPLGDGPFLLETAQQKIRVVVVTKGLSHPWSLAFLPDGRMLVTERVGRLRIVRDGVLD